MTQCRVQYGEQAVKSNISQKKADGVSAHANWAVFLKENSA